MFEFFTLPKDFIRHAKCPIQIYTAPNRRNSHFVKGNLRVGKKLEGKVDPFLLFYKLQFLYMRIPLQAHMGFRKYTSKNKKQL